MNRFIAIILFFIIVSFTKISAIESVVYVSSSIGNDSNSGLLEESPLQSINTALRKGDIICLKAGDVFYEDIVARNKKITRYGIGPNPILSGYKRIIDAKWIQVDVNIWRLDLLDKKFDGHIFQYGNYEQGVLNNIGAFHDIEKDKIYGRKVDSKNDLKADWDFFQYHTEDFEGKDMFQYVYLYLKENPNKLKLELSTGTIAAILYKSSMEYVNVEGFGFGISLRQSGIVRNCRIDAIGGRTLITAKSFICDGNGIGIWVDQKIDTDSVIVEDCYISRVFDAGICLQGSPGGIATAKNVVCRNNLIVNCCQGWEDVLNNSSLKPYENCIFKNNIVVFSGDSGFGYNEKRFKYCHVLGNNRTARKLMLLKDNVFIGGNYYCSIILNEKYNSNLWINNKCYLAEGNYLLSHYMGHRDVLNVNKENILTQIIKYRELTGDKTTTFYLKRKASINRLGRKYIKKYLKKHSY